MNDRSVQLGGPWLVRADLGDAGVRERWFDFIHDWETWPVLLAPAPFQAAQGPGLGPGFKGVGWTCRVEDLPEPWLAGPWPGQRLWLRFDSAATDCTVWVNGVEVGRHVGDFAPFEFDITAAAATPPSQAPAWRPDDGLSIACRVDQFHAPRPAPGVLTENGHITKGFHDVLSVQHAGLWAPVTLRRTGPLAIIPDGVHIVTTAENGRPTGEVRVEVELHAARVAGGDAGSAGVLRVSIGDARAEAMIALGATNASVVLRVPAPKLWSPESPELYTARVEVLAGAHASDSTDIRFGFRCVSTGGPRKTQILLNGRPLLFRGILHWGHEPRHIAPSPTPDEIRAQFAELRRAGFNGVCLCMVYMPRWFYDIADETGMLLWQEHPIWKSDMAEELLPEYQRLCSAYFRRDRNHPSVVIVSGSCEHERIHPRLAEWWWAQVRRHMPHTLAQVQTAFMAWVNPEQTDLHDEHVYENSGRWVEFLDDAHAEIARLGPKPFIMGETIIANAWPDIDDLDRELSPTEHDPSATNTEPDPRWTTHSPWFVTRGLSACATLERELRDQRGPEALERFRRQARRFGLEFRRWQAEVLRRRPWVAGWVMNHIRDVPLCRCGFMDDLDRWRYTPDELRPWLAERAITLATPDDLRGFTGGATIQTQVVMSNFGTTLRRAAGELRVRDSDPIPLDLGGVGEGESSTQTVSLTLPRADRTTCVLVRADVADIRNSWDLWAFPPPDELPEDTVRLDGLPYSKAEQAPTFEERAYSSGWGLKATRSVQPRLPDLAELLFKCPLVRFDAPLPPRTRLAVSTRLTRGLIEFASGGGRVVLLAPRVAGGLGSRTVMLWGQVPLVSEVGPLGPGDSDWVCDLLHMDLNRRHAWAVPTEELGWRNRVDAIVRYVFTHDAGVPKMFDALFATRVGRGLLTVTTLDHSGDPGRFLLHRLLTWAHAAEPASVEGELSPDDLAPHAAV